VETFTQGLPHNCEYRGHFWPLFITVFVTYQNKLESRLGLWYDDGMNDLPVSTLFMLMSADGKISTGQGDQRDFDKDLPAVPGVGEGLHQYYELEQQTDLTSFNTGRVMAKMGWNEEKSEVELSPVSFVIVDSQPHLTSRGITNLSKHVKKLYIVTTNINHPAHANTEINLEVVYIEGKIDFTDLFKHLKSAGVDNLTVQSGGEMDSQLIREGLISKVSLVVAPLLVGGKDTPSLVDGPSFITGADLRFLKPLALISADVLKDSYLHLQYEVK
jgi:2,5-diamino-6-(ribosylamino)-4(3H)-pyrimidinone 5'-phosphate reductase